MELFLASQSPRRRLLLRQWGPTGIAHEALHPGVDDALLEPGEVGARAWAGALAYLKARAGAELLQRAGRMHEQAMVIGADTVVVKGETLIGQPVDAADAERIVRLLEGGEHLVVSGVALVWRAREPHAPGVWELPWNRVIFADEARVRVGGIGSERVQAYIRSGEWRGKAGAYNLSERLEAGWPVEYEGDRGTIMGLPVQHLVAALQRLGHTV